MCRLEDKDELLLDDLEDTPPPPPEGLEAELRMGDICDYAEVLKVRNLGFRVFGCESCALDQKLNPKP